MKRSAQLLRTRSLRSLAAGCLLAVAAAPGCSFPSPPADMASAPPEHVPAAELFAREGAEVIAVDRNADALSTLSGCTTHVLDLTDSAAIQAFGAEAGHVDVLFNCAGYVDAGDLLATADAGYRLSFDLNVHAITHLLTALLPAMIAGGGGSIVNMASVAGPVIGVGNRYAYCASKAAVAGITSPLPDKRSVSRLRFAATLRGGGGVIDPAPRGSASSARRDGPSGARRWRFGKRLRCG